MVRLELLFFISFSLFVLNGCTSEVENEPQISDTDYLIFGTFYGECIGEGCIELFKIEDGSLYEDTVDLYPNGRDQYEGSFIELSSDMYEKVKELAIEIPEFIWDIETGTYGCPDCSDGGGVFILIKQGDATKAWTLDNFLNGIPEPLHEVVNKVQAAVAKLQ